MRSKPAVVTKAADLIPRKAGTRHRMPCEIDGGEFKIDLEHCLPPDIFRIHSIHTKRKKILLLDTPATARNAEGAWEQILRATAEYRLNPLAYGE